MPIHVTDVNDQPIGTAFSVPSTANPAQRGFVVLNQDGSAVSVGGTGGGGGTVSSTSAVTSVTADTAPVNLLLANSARKAATIYNNSTATLTMKLGAAPSTLSFTKVLAANEYFVVPGGYTGVITGLWAAINGAALVTELS